MILNNKGLAVKQYEPWYSDNHEFTFEDELTHYGVTPVMHYDPLGRLIQTDFPDGTVSRVEFDAWQQKNFDQNDCLPESGWYAERMAISETETDDKLKSKRRAAAISLEHANTPQVIDLDVLGRPFRTTDDNGEFGERCITVNKLDITGRITQVTDGLGRIATRNTYTLTGEAPVYVNNIDSGERRLLNDVAGKPLMKWDSRGHEFSYEYDELQRPTETHVNDACVERIVYGTNAVSNSIGQVVEVYAQDGKTSFEYDFKGNVISLRKQFLEDYNSMPDWGNTVLLGESFNTHTNYDALNRPVSIMQPDNTTVSYVYDKGGLLQKVLKDGCVPLSAFCASKKIMCELSTR